MFSSIFEFLSNNGFAVVLCSATAVWLGCKRPVKLTDFISPVNQVKLAKRANDINKRVQCFLGNYDTVTSAVLHNRYPLFNVLGMAQHNSTFIATDQFLQEGLSEGDVEGLLDFEIFTLNFGEEGDNILEVHGVCPEGIEWRDAYSHGDSVTLPFKRFTSGIETPSVISCVILRGDDMVADVSSIARTWTRSGNTSLKRASVFILRDAIKSDESIYEKLLLGESRPVKLCFLTSDLEEEHLDVDTK